MSSFRERERENNMQIFLHFYYLKAQHLIKQKRICSSQLGVEKNRKIIGEQQKNHGQISNHTFCRRLFHLTNARGQGEGKARKACFICQVKLFRKKKLGVNFKEKLPRETVIFEQLRQQGVRSLIDTSCVCVWTILRLFYLYS